MRRLTTMMCTMALTTAATALPPKPIQSLQAPGTETSPTPTSPTTTTTPTSAPTTSGGVDVTAQAFLNRRLTLLAFADDGDSALVFERSGGAIVTEAVWVVDDRGGGGVLPRGSPSQGANKNRDTRPVEAPAHPRAAMSRDYDLISVRVGMCAHPSRRVVTSLKTQAPVVVSAEIGKLHHKLGFPGRTFIGARARSGKGNLVVVIGEDIFGNDRVGVTRR